MKSLMLVVALVVSVNVSAGGLGSMLDNVSNVQIEQTRIKDDQRKNAIEERLKQEAKRAAERKVREAADKALFDQDRAHDQKLKAMQLRALEAELQIHEARSKSIVAKSDKIIDGEMDAYKAVTDIDKATAYSIKKVGDAAVVQAGQKVELHINKF